jgi:hypothetical protein
MITGKRYIIPERSHMIKIDALNKYKHKVGCQINSRPLLEIPFFSNNIHRKKTDIQILLRNVFYKEGNTRKPINVLMILNMQVTINERN